MKLDHKARSVEIKEISEEGEFEGYASVFGHIDAYNDTIEKGAFVKSLKKNSVRMLFNHNPSEVIGVWKSLEEDAKGLKVEGKLLKTIQRGAEMIELLRAKAIEGLSIGFRTVKAMRDEKTGIRRLMEADLHEISLVTFPADSKAKIGKVKSYSKVDLERILRNEGVPGSFAKSLVRFGYEDAQKKVGESRDFSTDIERMFK